MEEWKNMWRSFWILMTHEAQSTMTEELDLFAVLNYEVADCNLLFLLPTWFSTLFNQSLSIFFREKTSNIHKTDHYSSNFISLSVWNNLDRCKSITHGTKVFQRLEKALQLKALHKCVEPCLQLLAAFSISGVTCETSERRELKVHIVLTSYVADIAEWEHRLGMTRTYHTVLLFNRCFVNIAKTTQIARFRKKTLAETKRCWINTGQLVPMRNCQILRHSQRILL